MQNRHLQIISILTSFINFCAIGIRTHVLVRDAAAQLCC